MKGRETSLRIISGERRGLQLKSLKGTSTRPTSDKVKESVFNMIGPFFDGGIVVELFGGSGSLSLEALSRGADEAVIFEKNKEACKIIRSNIEKCRYNDLVHIQQVDARHASRYLEHSGMKVDFLFIDPPYAEESFYELAGVLAEAGVLSDRAIIVCEHERKTNLPQAYGVYEKVKSSTYGNIAISIYEK